MFAEELRLIFRRPRNIVILTLLGLVPALLGFLVKYFGGHGGNGGQGPPFFQQLTQNSLFLSLVGLVTIETFLLPMAVAFVSGDSIAGEAQSGALRYLLVAPISRTRLALTKMAASIVFGFVASFVVMGSGWLFGLLLFPHGAVVTLSGTVISEGHAFILSVQAALAVGIAMVSVVAISTYASTYTESPIAAVAIGLGVAIVSEILDPIPQLQAIATLLPSHYWQAFIDLFRTPTNYSQLIKEVISQLSWLLVGVVGSLLNFRSKDILT